MTPVTLTQLTIVNHQEAVWRLSFEFSLNCSNRVAAKHKQCVKSDGVSNPSKLILMMQCNLVSHHVFLAFNSS